MSALRQQLAGALLRTTLVYLAMGFLLVVAIALAGDEIERHIDGIEAWIASLGSWGLLIFVVLFVFATSLLIPDTLFSVTAGALFGLRWGIAAVVIGSLFAAMLQYALAQRLLRVRIERALTRRPSLRSVQRAVTRDQLRLQTLLRLTPLNPATISYILGAAGVGFSGFMLACLGIVPNQAIGVYFGYAGNHVARMSARSAREVYLHDVTLIGGLVVTVVVMVLVSKMARKALMDAVSKTETTTSD